MILELGVGEPALLRDFNDEEWQLGIIKRIARDKYTNAVLMYYTSAGAFLIAIPYRGLEHLEGKI